MSRRARFSVAVVAFALAIAGCGSGSPGAAQKNAGDVLQVIQAAAASTAQQRTEQVRGTMTMDLGAITGASTGSVSVNLAGIMQTKPLAGRLTVSGMSVAGHNVGDIKALITPAAMYMNMPILAAQVGKPWIEIKFSEIKAASGFDFHQFTSQAQQMQPSQYIAQLASSGDVDVVGTETVNGVSTTHYAGSVSLKDQLSHYSPALRAQMQPLLDKAGFTGTHIDVWLDGKGLVRRVKSSAEGGKGTLAVDMDVLAYGVPLDTTPPPASQVADLAQLAGAASSG
jgi:hypothetical protein